jgi:hypothetical protein
MSIRSRTGWLRAILLSEPPHGRTLNANVRSVEDLGFRPPPYDQSPNLREHALTTSSRFFGYVLARYQLPMPAENRVGRDDRGNVKQAATAQPMSDHR